MMNREYVQIIKAALKKVNLDHLEIRQGADENEYCFGNITIEEIRFPRSERPTEYRVWSVDEKGNQNWYEHRYTFTDAVVAGVIQILIEDLEKYLQDV